MAGLLRAVSSSTQPAGAQSPVLAGCVLFAMACGSSGPSPPSTSSYIVTIDPIVVGVGRGVCLAVNPNDAQGAWWWGPGQSGCATRSTGSGLFQPDDIKVIVVTGSERIDVSFRMQVHALPGSATYRDVRVTIQGRDMLAEATGARVKTERRNDLEIPEEKYGR